MADMPNVHFRILLRSKMPFQQQQKWRFFQDWIRRVPQRPGVLRDVTEDRGEHGEAEGDGGNVSETKTRIREASIGRPNQAEIFGRK